jgi:8-oxo-dGTP pyrophosphatase MutT (NUDIX family)
MNFPVKPKHSATVILINRTQNGLHVYMTKRPESMKSYPGHYVFPGGKLMKSDSTFKQEDYHFGQVKPHVDLAYYVAAARELFEETGVLLCLDRIGVPVQPDAAWDDVRKAIIQGDLEFGEFIRNNDYLIYISGLHYFGHRITSLQRPYRFNTRFFLADLPVNQDPTPITTEIESGCWFKPKEAIEQHEKSMLKMVMPTIQSLTALLNYNSGELPILPVIEYTKEFY